MRRPKPSQQDYQKCEPRLCLAVAVGVHHGSMVVHGDADGAVEAVAAGQQSYTVTDNGVDVGTFDHIHHCLRVDLDRNEAGDAKADTVSIELRDQEIHNIMVMLGHGDNDFQISGERAVDRVMYRGASGNDSMTVNVNTRFMADGMMGGGDNNMEVNSHANRVRLRTGHGADRFTSNSDAAVVTAVMGHGANNFDVNGNVHHHMFFRGGNDADTVDVSDDTHTHGSVAMNFGHGDNVVNYGGRVDGHLRFRGGDGSDVVNMGASSFVGHHAGIVLGGGDNTYNIDGDFRHGLFMRGEDGNDDVNLAETLEVGWSVSAVLGDGENTLNHDGLIHHNLWAVSKNADDVFTVDGTVEGKTHLDPGGQKGG